MFKIKDMVESSIVELFLQKNGDGSITLKGIKEGIINSIITIRTKGDLYRHPAINFQEIIKDENGQIRVYN